MKRFLSILGGCFLAVAAAAAQGGEYELSDLMIRDADGTKSYAGVVAPPQPQWWMKGLPMPLRHHTLAWLPDEAAWMKDFDFDGDNWITTAEMTQAWLVYLARLKTAQDYAPDSIVAVTDAGPVALKGLTISIDAERSVRAAYDELAGSGFGGRTPKQEAVHRTVELVRRMYWGTTLGGDGGHGMESDGGEASATFDEFGEN